MGVCTDVWCFCVLGALAHCLSALSHLNHNLQNLLNTLWYQLALVVLTRLDRWPNYTTGQLAPIPRFLTTAQVEEVNGETLIEIPIVEEFPQMCRAEVCHLRETQV